MYEDVKINKIFYDELEEDDYYQGLIHGFFDAVEGSINNNNYKNHLFELGKRDVIVFLCGGERLCNEKSNKDMIRNLLIRFAIHNYTIRDNKYPKGDSRYLKYLHEHKAIENLNIDESGDIANVQIVINDGYIIQFYVLSDFLDCFYSINMKAINHLESENRIGFCHAGSIEIAKIIENKDSNLVSGKVYSLDADGEKSYFHSWIEISLKRKEIYNGLYLKCMYESRGILFSI